MSFRGKVILLGDPNVGKTSLLARYVNDQFKAEYDPTIGANFLIREIDLSKIIDKINIADKAIKENIKKKGFKLYFWDIGGQKDKLYVTEYYFEYAVGAIVIFNLIDSESFKNLEFWILKLKELCGTVPFIIIGNKLDLVQKPVISKEEIKKKVEQYKVAYFETSAKLNRNVAAAFETLSVQIINNFKP